MLSPLWLVKVEIVFSQQRKTGLPEVTYLKHRNGVLQRSNTARSIATSKWRSLWTSFCHLLCINWITTPLPITYVPSNTIVCFQYMNSGAELIFALLGKEITFKVSLEGFMYANKSFKPLPPIKCLFPSTHVFHTELKKLTLVSKDIYPSSSSFLTVC